MQFHEDPLSREELIAKYLRRRLDAESVEEFESHYLGCEECFAELEASQRLMVGLAATKLSQRHLADVLLVSFSSPAQLTRQSREFKELMHSVLEQKDSRVIIDLGRVSRIDSAGLGLLMSCYSHAVCNRGMLKLLNPSAEVRRVLEVTHMDSVFETYQDEAEALRSFGSPR